MDFVEGLSKSKGKDSVLVVVYQLTKFTHFIALKHPFTASTIADEFIKVVVRLHGFPSSIVSNRDKLFMSIFWIEQATVNYTQKKFGLSSIDRWSNRGG